MEKLPSFNEMMGQSKRVDEILKELPKMNRERKAIIAGRFGGMNIFTSYAAAQLVTGFNHDKNLLEAFTKCPDKSKVFAMVGSITEIGYIIAEERYERKVKTLEAKLVIAESEVEKLKGGDNGR